MKYIIEFYVIIYVTIIISTQVISVSYDQQRDVEEDPPIRYSLVKSWADKLGIELWHLGDFITRRKEVQDSFKTAQVVPRTGQTLIQTMANDIKLMLDSRISAIKRIMETAENTAIYHEKDLIDSKFEYYNAKEMLEPLEPTPPNVTRDTDEVGLPPIYVNFSRITLTPNRHFFNIPVNTSLSSVHVPTNVFARADEVIKAIKWSEKLDSIFVNNYQADPTLSWQFFGSSTGFMRQFPASKWKQSGDQFDPVDPVDLYDCRLRSWYIEAATSPKDMVILLDTSGSMTGRRYDIAKHVVNNILDTLGTNDFVNIYKFDEHVEAIIPCFNETLVQATLGNLRELKMGLKPIKTCLIANYSAALTKAFEILENYRLSEGGARCNQAIMLISDGVPSNYRDIFEAYNWQNNSFMPVRVFTYLIGKEVADVKEIKDMACSNQGFYVHLSTFSEVREQVLNYVSVMARPLVLGKQFHPIVWTQVYADVIDPQMTDWKWEQKECKKQKELFDSQRRDRPNFMSQSQQHFRSELRQKMVKKSVYGSGNYHLMTTVAIPVYDRRENATSIANLLGVAGTDIPIRDIKKLMMPFALGVNGYAFIVTNNGFILTHPDLRPVFQDILKPSYNSIDMIEIELLDDDTDPRDFSPILLEIRELIVNQTTDSKWMTVKYHFDEMKRVSRVKRQYYWTPIVNTPFTLVLTYPEPYGLYRVQIRYEEEIHRLHAKGNDILGYFSDIHWKIHPDWIYCKHSTKSFASPEKELKYFLTKITGPGWKWKDRTPPPPEHAALYCDRGLVQELVYDARVTEWFSKNVSFIAKQDKVNELKLRFGIRVAFLATHSGLTRWLNFDNNKDDVQPGSHFSENNIRAIDEIWYKRAVEQHYIESQSFVFSVPFDTGNNSEALVTASHAIFHTEDKKSAPVAVVGFQFQYSSLYALFKNITSNCGPDCVKTCFPPESIECFVLDNNGYILISPDITHTGKFFGEVRGAIMHRLITEEVYKEIHIYDYQAVCFPPKNELNLASILETPIKFIIAIFQWAYKFIFWLTLHIAMLPVKAYGDGYEEFLSEASTYDPIDIKETSKDKEKAFDTSVIINRTRLQPCDQILKLYTLHKPYRNKTAYQTPSHGCERPFTVLPIPQSNLILLIVESMCPVDPNYRFTTNPLEQHYNNETVACFRSNVPLKRKRPKSCVNSHINESYIIEQCGRGSTKIISVFLIAYCLILNCVYLLLL